MTRTKKTATNSTPHEQHTKADEAKENKEAETKESPFLNDCIKVFGTSELYLILSLNKTDASQNDIKKAYYRLSLKYHPDKCTDESQLDDHKFKFQLLGKIYSILSDNEKKKLYDDCGLIDGEDSFFSESDRDWEAHWRTMFKKITEDDIVEYFKKYKGSPEERIDLFRIYDKHQGNLNLIMSEMISEDAIEDEERFKEMLNEGIKKEEIKSFDLFVNEDKKAAKKRKAKYEKEAQEAEQLKKEKKLDDGEDSLKLAILQNAERRKNQADNFLDKLAKKYEEKGSAKKTKKSKKTEESDDEDTENLDEESEAEEDDLDNDDDDSDEQEKEEKNKKTKPKRTSSILKKKPPPKAAASLKSKPSIKKRVKRL